jgi:hypothetical protein
MYTPLLDDDSLPFRISTGHLVSKSFTSAMAVEVTR